jgi:tetratricopeptide (TPR) repeat protein
VTVWLGRILIPLGLWGLLWNRRRAGWLLAAAALSGFVASLLTFASADHRLVTMTACVVGLGLWIQGMLRRSNRGRMVGVLGGLLAVALWGLWPVQGGTPGLGVTGDDSYFLGTVYDREQRGSAAMREYERSLRLDSTNPYPHMAIASMLARDNVNDEAIRQLEHLREQRPDFAPVLFSLVGLYQAQERWAEAAAVYGELIRLEPWNPEHWNNLGTMYVQIGFYDQAIRALQSALQIDPGYASARENLKFLQSWGFAPGAPEESDTLRVAQEEILALMRNGNYDAAEDSLSAAYERFGSDRLEFQFLEGTLRLLRGELEKAVQVLESVRSRSPRNVIMLFNLGTAYQRLGRLEKAKAVFEEAKRLQPTNRKVLNSLHAVEAALDSLGRN